MYFVSECVKVYWPSVIQIIIIQIGIGLTVLITIKEIRQKLALEESVNICHSLNWQINHWTVKVHVYVISILSPLLSP